MRQPAVLSIAASYNAAARAVSAQYVPTQEQEQEEIVIKWAPESEKQIWIEPRFSFLGWPVCTSLGADFPYSQLTSYF